MDYRYNKTAPSDAYGKKKSKSSDGVKKKRRKVVNRKRTRGKA